MPKRVIPPELWYDIKRRWRLGEFDCVEDMFRWARKKYPKFPSMSSIQQRMKIDGDWVRGALDKIEQERVEAATIRLFEEKMMPHSKVVDSIVAGIEGASQLIQQYIKESKDSSGGVMTSGILDKIEEARRYQLPWIEQYKDLTGMIAPTKRVIEIDLEAKWGVAQDEACNEAYLRRFGRHPDQQKAQDAEYTDRAKPALLPGSSRKSAD